MRYFLQGYDWTGELHFVHFDMHFARLGADVGRHRSSVSKATHGGSILSTKAVARSKLCHSCRRGRFADEKRSSTSFSPLFDIEAVSHTLCGRDDVYQRLTGG